MAGALIHGPGIPLRFAGRLSAPGGADAWLSELLQNGWIESWTQRSSRVIRPCSAMEKHNHFHTSLCSPKSGQILLLSAGLYGTEFV